MTNKFEHTSEVH